MLVESDQMMPVTKLKKNLSETVKKINKNNSSVYIIDNNAMEAVIVPFHEYEYLSMLNDTFEHFEIAQMLRDRMKDYKAEENFDWEDVKNG